MPTYQPRDWSGIENVRAAVAAALDHPDAITIEEPEPTREGFVPVEKEMTVTVTVRVTNPASAR